MSEITLSNRTFGLSGGFVGTLICACGGILLSVVAVLFSVAGSLTTKLLGLGLLLVGAVLCGLARTLPPAWKLRLSAVLISTCCMLLIAEGLLRLLTPYPVNTSSNMVPHPKLGYVLDPKLSDVDAKGFRNPNVPEQADLVAIGDSHTQGLNAASAESWPHVLGLSQNQTVYNMGVGGYGPLQYEQLVEQALEMQPKTIVIGLYLGNDLGDVVRGIRSRHSERQIDNSFRYGLKYHTAIGSAMTQLIRTSSFGRPPGFEVTVPHNPTYVADSRLTWLANDMDLSNSKIEGALNTTLKIITDADEKCRQQNVRLCVLLIPTRESVYFHATENVNREPWKKLAQTETDVRSRILSALEAGQVQHTDLLPALTDALKTTPDVYPQYDEGHPLPAGYEVYATAAAKLLN